ncbi:hypothetical protein [Bradyrhizobium sp.]|jgi:hypothetical protein|nr:hypothetical protein [Bradyrhizobium sp.]MDO9295058.1 hypothetical protein [Bradyrhizobium sp.]
MVMTLLWKMMFLEWPEVKIAVAFGKHLRMAADLLAVMHAAKQRR